VKLVVADTSPINYLILIGHISVLPALFHRVILPTAVRDELAAPKASPLVRNWIEAQPEWIEVRDSHSSISDPIASDPIMDELDRGERAAIILAAELQADLLLIDDREGVNAARAKGFRVADTLAVLTMAAERDLLDLVEAIERLRNTNFRCRQDVIDRFIQQHRRRT
jgi:predicted nucleic acid-binding protein